jgi:hypothetical protein
MLQYSGAISTDFIMTIDTTKAGSASNTFILPCANAGVYDAVIDWGDGNTSNITTYNDADLTHVYSVGGVYQLKVTGSIPYICFSNAGDKLKVLSIDNWGYNQWYGLDNAYYGCSNMVVNATDIPDISAFVNRLYRVFRGTAITTIPNFNQWETSSIITMVGMFMSCPNLTNIDMSGMNFSSVIQFGANASDAMFLNCTGLNNVDLTGATLNSVGNVNMRFMFSNCGAVDIVGLDTLNIEKVNNFASFMSSTTITTIEYDKLLVAWDSQDAVNSLAVNFGSSKYTLLSASATARAGLIANDLWTITDGGGI